MFICHPTYEDLPALHYAHGKWVIKCKPNRSKPVVLYRNWLVTGGAGTTNQCHPMAIARLKDTGKKRN